MYTRESRNVWRQKRTISRLVGFKYRSLTSITTRLFFDIDFTLDYYCYFSMKLKIRYMKHLHIIEIKILYGLNSVSIIYNN